MKRRLFALFLALVTVLQPVLPAAAEEPEAETGAYVTEEAPETTAAPADTVPAPTETTQEPEPTETTASAVETAKAPAETQTSEETTAAETAPRNRWYSWMRTIRTKHRSITTTLRQRPRMWSC